MGAYTINQNVEYVSCWEQSHRICRSKNETGLVHHSEPPCSKDTTARVVKHELLVKLVLFEKATSTTNFTLSIQSIGASLVTGKSRVLFILDQIYDATILFFPLS